MERSIFSLTDLQLLSDLLVESLFDLSTAEHSSDDAAWSGLFFVDTQKRSRVRRNLFSTEYEAVFVPRKLRIEGIRSVIVRDGSRIGLYSFEGCTLNANRLKLTFIENMDISFLLTESCSSLLVEKPEYPRYFAKYKYYHWLGIESGPYDLQRR